MEDKMEQEEKGLTPTNRGQAQEFPQKTCQIDGVSPLLQLAMQPGFDPSNLAKMMELQERHEASEARKAYHKALAEFKAEAPAIEKDKKVSFPGKGGEVAYSHSTLANALSKVNPVLSKHGLSLTWKTEQEGGQIKVTAFLTHNQGHGESTSLAAGADSSGSKNSIQAIGSTISYLERYTAFSLLGLASADQDNDGATAETISAVQLGEIQALIVGTGFDPVAVTEAIKNENKVESLEFLPIQKFDAVKRNLLMTGANKKGSK